jgi:osmoprotectant transport system ATP-binding protein
VSESISLRAVTKRYPGTDEPAVDAIDLEIAAGEVLCLVGPSGCGKTTTMRMINRLIEPTSGQVLLGSDDVMDLDVEQLRRRIGYVIQQVGLFPHLTIEQNVALVPRLVGWDKKRTKARVEEMLHLVGLEPATYSGRHPRQLSGGQQQRVGVARALAADPEIMLMDEPFGAVDPITRARLQDEFLALQDRLQKTIVFVTHDFDEAIKMGTRIAVLRAGSRIAQHDTPAAILAAPADDFVAGFVGRGANLKQLALQVVADQRLEPDDGDEALPTVTADASLHDALDVMLGRGTETVRVLADGSSVGRVTIASIMAEIRAVRAGEAS